MTSNITVGTELRVNCSREELGEKLGLVNRAVSTRSSVQILSGIMLRGGEGQLEVSATDMELSWLSRKNRKDNRRPESPLRRAEATRRRSTAQSRSCRLSRKTRHAPRHPADARARSLIGCRSDACQLNRASRS